MTCTPIPISKDIRIPSQCKLVIFDLDDTLRDRDLYLLNKIYHRKQLLPPYIIDIIFFLRMNQIQLAVASLHMHAKQHLEIYKIKHCFDQIEYRKNWDDLSKTNMLANILLNMSVNPENAILFDDRIQHCKEATDLGMKSVLVNYRYGLTWQDIRKGMDMFLYNESSSSIPKLHRRHSCIIF